MNPDLEEQKKAIIPFLQRAQEIQQADPKIAYYCRLYAVEQALQFKQRAKEINSLVAATMAALEKDRPNLGIDKEADKFYCEEFALRIFSNADRVDRAGRADLNTAKAFYAASIFMEIVNQFAEVGPEIMAKQRYAAWRAVEIRKAIREGRAPTPPPSDMDAGSTPTSSGSLGQRFVVGSKVLLQDPDGGETPIRGTVGQVLPGPAVRYKVGLPTHIVEVADRELAVEAAAGEEVYHIARNVSAAVAQGVTQTWPPNYLVHYQDGSQAWVSGLELSSVPALSNASPAHSFRSSSLIREDMNTSSGHIPGQPPPMPQPMEHAQFAPGPANGEAHSYASAPCPSTQAPFGSTTPNLATTSAPAYPSAGLATFGQPLHSYPSGAVAQPLQHPSQQQQYAPLQYSLQQQQQQQPQYSPQYPGPAAGPAGAIAGARALPAAAAAPAPMDKLPLATITEAQKHAKHAVSALSFEDVPTAIKSLTLALDLLTRRN